MLLSTVGKAAGVGGRRDRRGSAWADAGVCVRKMDEADLVPVQELRRVVRWAADPRAFDLLRGVRDARWAVAEGSDGALVGMVGAVPLGPVGVLCHLAVRDGYRGLGLGAGLSSWAVAYLRSRGTETVRLYATVEAEGIYRSLGFEASAARTVYQREGAGGRTGCPVEDDEGSVRTLAFADLPELYGVDRWIDGADRSPLIFATLRLHPGGGLVARDSSGRIEGYLIRSEGDDAIRLGPFVAATGEVARTLLTRVLREAGPSPVRVIVPGPEKGPAHDLLRAFGFVGRRDRLRMELGRGTPERPSGLVHYGTTPYLAT